MLHLEGLSLIAFSHPCTYGVSYVFPPPTLVPLGLSTVSGRTCSGQFRLLIQGASCWTEAPWLATVLNMLEDIPVSYFKGSHHGCFSRSGVIGSAVSTFNPLLLIAVCWPDKDSLP